MTTTSNIQTDGNTAIQHTNKMTEEGTMNHANDNINIVARISNAFRMGSISKFVAGATLGLALTIGLAMPGDARADSPLVSVSSSNLVNNLNDDFSMVYGIPDNGPGRSGVTASARVKLNTDTDFWNDDFSMLYGIPDNGPGRSGGGVSGSAKVKINAVTDLLNDDFSMVYGIPDNGPGRGVSTSARAKAKINTGTDGWNDDFSLIYGTPDNIS